MPEVKLNPFQQVISDYLQGRAQADELFADTLKKPAKSIEQCCIYIEKQAKAGGRTGYADAEVFGWAVHYYDEDDITGGAPINAKVVINKEVKLTEEDLEAAKKIAMDKAVAQATANIAKKPVKKAEPVTNSQPSLF